jgi:hypothetical protein
LASSGGFCGVVGDAVAAGDFRLGVFSYAIIGGLAAITTASILLGAIVYGTVQDLNGARPKVFE